MHTVSALLPTVLTPPSADNFCCSHATFLLHCRGVGPPTDSGDNTSYDPRTALRYRARERQVFVKLLKFRWCNQLHAHTLFFTYRWIAWFIAALALTLPGHPVAALPRDIGILLLTGVINIIATALAEGYVRLARVRPLLLALDLVVGATILWLSGSTRLPFFAYSLCGLMLPTLLYGWRGGLLGSVTFLVLDLIGLLSLTTPVSGATVGARFAIVLTFLAGWMLVGRWTNEPAVGRSRVRAPESGLSSPLTIEPDPTGTDRSTFRTTKELRNPKLFKQRQEDLRATQSLVLTSATDQHAMLFNRMLEALPTHEPLSLITTLDRMGALFAEQIGVEVRVGVSGTPLPLRAVQQSLLLRTVQEAFLNVQRHAHAQHVAVQLRYTCDTITLTIQDDGIGLLDGTYERPGMHALRSLRYRLAEFDGQLSVFEGESGGVTVRAMIPHT